MKTQESIMLFKFHSRPIRTAVHEGQNWFCAKDVCEALNIKWSRKSTLAPIPETWKQGLELQAPNGRSQASWFISEPAVYKLAFRSNRPEAESFTNWVAGEVLPALRKTGVYGMTQTLALQEVARAKKRNVLIAELRRLESEPLSGVEYVALLDYFKEIGTPLIGMKAITTQSNRVRKECRRTGQSPICRYLPGRRSAQNLWPRPVLEAITTGN